LVQAEKQVTAGKYDAVHKTFDALRLADGKHSDRPGGVNLPVFLLHRLLTTEFENDGDYLVGTIVPRGGAILSYGLPKGLKSWFSTGVALDAAIGDGRALGYFDVPRPVRVLLVQVEDPASRTKNRFQKLIEARPFRKSPYPGDLRVVTRCPLNLLDPNWMEELEAVIAKQRTELVIFDVFRRLFRGNVNDPEETAAFLEAVDRLRDKYGLAAWIVHHSNKRSEGEMMTKALGSINLTAWPDVLLYFKHKQESDGITACNLEMETKDEAIEGELKVILDDEAEPMLWVGALRFATERGLKRHATGRSDTML
jgi:AAA domain